MEHLWAVWFISGLLLILLEILTPGFVVSLIGVACLVSGLFSLFTNNIIVQLLAFAVSLVLLMIYIRPIFSKYFTKNDNKKSAVDALIGKVCVVDEEIDNSKPTGYVKCEEIFGRRSLVMGVLSKRFQVTIEKIEGITVTVSLKGLIHHVVVVKYKQYKRRLKWQD